jgi:hypothetical protein
LHEDVYNVIFCRKEFEILTTEPFVVNIIKDFDLDICKTAIYLNYYGKSLSINKIKIATTIGFGVCVILYFINKNVCNNFNILVV